MDKGVNDGESSESDESVYSGLEEEPDTSEDDQQQVRGHSDHGIISHMFTTDVQTTPAADESHLL